ncbi:HPP family protein [candidate division KSB1 bacterium]
MKICNVEEVMIYLDKYPHVPPDYTILEAMKEISKSEFDIDGQKSLPRVLLIFDEDYRMLGMVRRRDILHGLEPEYLESKPKTERKKLFDLRGTPKSSELSSEKLIIDIKDRSKRPISEVMIPIHETVYYDDSILKAIYKMVQNDIHILPVLKDNKVIGVIRSVDVFNEIYKLLSE